MKILISAIACNPYSGSELYVGWSAVKALIHDHDLWVITSIRNRPDLERAASMGLIPPNVHFAYPDLPGKSHPNRMVARLQSWRDYVHFSKISLPLARRLHQEEKFDLVHHVTYASWRVASPLWQLGIPFVFGPIGGNEHFPPRFLSMLSPSAAAFELARMSSNFVSRFSPGVRQSLQQAAHVFVANSETEQLVKAVRGSGQCISRLMAAFHSELRVASFSRFVMGKNLDGPLRLFAAGNMEGRKGVAMALQALALAKARGVRFCYRLGAHGPEIAHLRRLAGKLGLENDIAFADNLRGDDYQRELGSTHVFLLPSLRESSGLTMMEAMLAGCVPVVAACGGPDIMVTDECGYKIPVTNRARMVTQLAEIIMTLDRSRIILREKGRAASHRIAREFSEENYRQAVNATYRLVTRQAMQ